MEFISTPVISGFVSAAALTVGSTQMKGLLGLKFEGSSFVEIWTGVFSNLRNIRAPDAGLGFSCIALLLLMRKMTVLADLACTKRCFGQGNVFFKKLLWFVSTSRNAVAVIGGCIATYLLKQNGLIPFSLTGLIPVKEINLKSLNVN